MGFFKNELKELKNKFKKDSLINRITFIVFLPLLLFISGLPGVLLTIWFWDAEYSDYSGLVIKIPLNFFLIIAILAFLYFLWCRYLEYDNKNYYNEEISEIEKNKNKNKDWNVDLFRISRKKYMNKKFSLWTFYVSYFLFCTWFVYFVWKAVLD